ncbi:hypothetical protein ACRAWF_16010 [Streptomyces sp. L7]
MFKKILTVVVAAVGLAVAATAPAAAIDSGSSKNACGVVYFYPDGDTFKFLDTCSGRPRESSSTGRRRPQDSRTRPTPPSPRRTPAATPAGTWTTPMSTTRTSPRAPASTTASVSPRAAATSSGSYGSWTLSCA